MVEPEPSGPLQELEATLAEAFDQELFGFPWYAGIADEEVRAVRSNQAIGLVDAAVAHLEALEFAAAQVSELVGPNGRTMPTLAEHEELRINERIRVEITDALRAAGSLLDVLGGLAVLFLGLPVDPARADSRQLLRCEPGPVEPHPDQARAVARLRDVGKEAAEHAPGWIAWTLESRNAMVHRGRSMTMWLPVAPKLPRGLLAVVTKMEPHRVTRQMTHMRRMPDLSDAEIVLSGAKYDEAWLPEPAQDTLGALAQRCHELASAAAQMFIDLVKGLDHFSWPIEAWRLASRSPRAQEADRFRGFRNDAEVPEVSSMHMSPREAMRLLTVETLRLRRPSGED